MNFLPEPLLEQLELNFFIKKAMYLWGIAFFVVLLFVSAGIVSVSFYRQTLTDCEAQLKNPKFMVSDMLSRLRREAEDNMLKQERILEAIDVNSLDMSDVYRITRSLPEELYAWELGLTSQTVKTLGGDRLEHLRQGELEGVAVSADGISKFAKRLKAGGNLESFQLLRLHKYSEDRTDFTAAFQWKGRGEP